MNTNSADDACVERMLRQGADSPLSDGGFSARVLAALPPPLKHTPFDWANAAVFAVGAASGLVFVAWRGAVWPGFLPALAQIEQTLLNLSDQFVDPGLSLGLIVTTGALAFLLISDDSPETQP